MCRPPAGTRARRRDGQRLRLEAPEGGTLRLDEVDERRRGDLRAGQVGEVDARLGQPVHLGVHVAGVDEVEPHAAALELGRQDARDCSSAALLAP